MDLSRLILLAIENSVDDEPASIRLPIRTYDDLHISHHVRLLKEAGFIHAIENHRLQTGVAWIPHSLTWQGHDFLNAIRDDEVWAGVRKVAADTGGDLPSQIIHSLALDAMKKKFGLA